MRKGYIMKQVCIRAILNRYIDADILAWLNRVPSVSGYLKALVRYDLQHGLISQPPVCEVRIVVNRRMQPGGVRKAIGLNPETEAGIIWRLRSVPSVGAYIRVLVRLDMERHFIDMATIKRKS